MALCARVQLHGARRHIARIADIAPVASYTVLDSTGLAISSYVDQNRCYVSYIQLC
jgi:hypothetical protein